MWRDIPESHWSTDTDKNTITKHIPYMFSSIYSLEFLQFFFRYDVMAWLEVNAVVRNKYFCQYYLLHVKRLQITFLSLKYALIANECASNYSSVFFNDQRTTFSWGTKILIKPLSKCSFVHATSLSKYFFLNIKFTHVHHISSKFVILERCERLPTIS